jgi:ribose 5-phosphate isomerase B
MPAKLIASALVHNGNPLEKTNRPLTTVMHLAVSTDERTALVDVLLEELKRRGHEVLYFGPQSEGETSDWPDVTLAAVEAVRSGAADEAIVTCWTGTGCSIAANKVPGIRAALCRDAETARGARIWNHANVLALSLRATSVAVLREVLDSWFETPLSDDAWNLRQIDRLRKLDGERAAREERADT